MSTDFKWFQLDLNPPLSSLANPCLLRGSPTLPVTAAVKSQALWASASPPVRRGWALPSTHALPVILSKETVPSCFVFMVLAPHTPCLADRIALSTRGRWAGGLGRVQDPQEQCTKKGGPTHPSHSFHTPVAVRTSGLRLQCQTGSGVSGGANQGPKWKQELPLRVETAPALHP